jgi:uncharacterized protein
MNTKNYRTEVVSDLAQLDAVKWNELLALQEASSPFMRHENLLALHQSESACVATGWKPCFIVVLDGDEWQAACPVYLKTHSYGEYVFDWVWAQAYQRHGLQYYPKLVVSVPFTPVPGTRLMCRTPQARQALLVALETLAQQHQASSTHVLFCPPLEAQAATGKANWMLRDGIQFHWTNRSPLQWESFDEFLDGMRREKRKKILQERRKVLDAGVEITKKLGSEITAAEWDFFYLCYERTYHLHGTAPYLTRAYFAQMAQTMPDHWLLFVAHRAGQAIAASLIALDWATKTAFGRYWGCTEDVSMLHFEACYYAPLAWCIEQRFNRFEGGAQGVHKLARGLLPTPTQSAHWVAHEGFRGAIHDHLAAERAAVSGSLNDLSAHSPMRDSEP